MQITANHIMYVILTIGYKEYQSRHTKGRGVAGYAEYAVHKICKICKVGRLYAEVCIIMQK